MKKKILKIQNYSLFISVVDGTSKEVSLQDKSEAWSSWALVIFLGIALTLLIISIAIGLLAKMNSNTATQQRRQRAAAAAAAASANRHSAQMAVASGGKMNNHHDDYNNDTLISQAFQSPQELPDRSPDVIPHFKNGGGNGFLEYLYNMSSANMQICF